LLEGVSEELGFTHKHGDDVESIASLFEIMIGSEPLGRTAQDLLLPSVHEFPRFAKLARALHSYLNENQRILLKGNDIQLARAVGITSHLDAIFGSYDS